MRPRRWMLLVAALGACSPQPDALPAPDDAAPAGDTPTPDDTAPAPDTAAHDIATLPPDVPISQDVGLAGDAPPAMDTPTTRDVAVATDTGPPRDVSSPDAPPPMDAPVARDAPPDLGPPLPYPSRSTYRLKALQPDYWPDLDEVVGNNTGGVAVNILWSEWEPTRRSPGACTGPRDVVFDGHCFTVPAHLDAAIQQYSARGLVVTGVLYGSPAWARGPCTPPTPGFAIFCAPNDVSDFARFTRLIAQRYDGRRAHGRVADFVLWNEVNANDWYDIGCGNGGPACDPTRWIASYSALYAAAYDAIVAEQPAARVLISLEHHFGAALDAPGARNPLLSGETFLRGFAPRVAPRAWRVAYHPYAPDLLRPAFSADDWPRVTYGNLGTLLGWLRRTFPDVPSAWEVELTESGINSVGPGSTAAAQATAVCDTFRNVLGTPGIDNYVYHRMVDHPDELVAGLGLGLRNPDRSAKPAWAVWALANRNDLTPPQLSCGFEDVPYTRLVRSHHTSRGHWASTRLAPAGFRTEQAWYLWRDPRPGTHMLYECRVGQHNLLTPDPNCEAQHPMGPVGYIHAAAAPDTVPLYRCYVPGNGDHFVSADPACEGQRTERLLGHARTRR